MPFSSLQICVDYFQDETLICVLDFTVLFFYFCAKKIENCL